MGPISDYDWLEANLYPALYRTKLNISIPDLPPAEVQMRFTGRAGRENLQQAFDFYKFVLANLSLHDLDHPLLDFGGGWGRVLRFFLREFPPERLILVDALREAIDCARGMNPPFHVLHNNISPPLSIPGESVGTCYAFSVFSHLAEQQCLDWLSHLSSLLITGGKLIITTRGKWHIDYLARLDQKDTPLLLAASLPRAETILERYERGVFQFYPTGGGGELSSDFYGESWIPKKWLEERHRSLGFSTISFYEEFQTIDQCVFVLTK